MADKAIAKIAKMEAEFARLKSKLSEKVRPDLEESSKQLLVKEEKLEEKVKSWSSSTAESLKAEVLLKTLPRLGSSEVSVSQGEKPRAMVGETQNDAIMITSTSSSEDEICSLASINSNISLKLKRHTPPSLEKVKDTSCINNNGFPIFRTTPWPRSKSNEPTDPFIDDLANHDDGKGSTGKKLSDESKFLEESLPADEDWDKCGICLEDFSYDDNMLIYCSGCDTPVHQLCYNIVEVPAGEWYCYPCSLQVQRLKKRKIAIGEISKHIKKEEWWGKTEKCSICGIQGNQELILAVLKRQMRSSKREWCHIVCAQFISELWFSDSQFKSVCNPEGLYQRRMTEVCSVCKMLGGAKVLCSIVGCKKKFHASCGIIAGNYLQDIAEINEEYSNRVVYCAEHHPDKIRRSGDSKLKRDLERSFVRGTDQNQNNLGWGTNWSTIECEKPSRKRGRKGGESRPNKKPKYNEKKKRSVSRKTWVERKQERQKKVAEIAQKFDHVKAIARKPTKFPRQSELLQEVTVHAARKFAVQQERRTKKGKKRKRETKKKTPSVTRFKCTKTASSAVRVKRDPYVELSKLKSGPSNKRLGASNTKNRQPKVTKTRVKESPEVSRSQLNSSEPDIHGDKNLIKLKNTKYRNVPREKTKTSKFQNQEPEDPRMLKSYALFCVHCDLRFEAKPLIGSKPNSPFFSHACSLERKTITRKLEGLFTPQCAIKHEGRCFMLYSEREKHQTSFIKKNKCCLKKFDPTRKYMPTTKMMFVSSHGYMKSSALLGTKSRTKSGTPSPGTSSSSQIMSCSNLKISKASRAWSISDNSKTLVGTPEKGAWNILEMSHSGSGRPEELLNQLVAIEQKISVSTTSHFPTEPIPQFEAGKKIEEPVMFRSNELTDDKRAQYPLIHTTDREKEVWRGRIQGGRIPAFNARFLLIGGYNTNHLALPFYLQMNGRIQIKTLGSYLPQMTSTRRKNVSLCEIHPLQMSDYNSYNAFCNYYKDIQRGAVFDQTRNLGWLVYILPADEKGIEENIYLDSFSCTPTPGIMSCLVIQYTAWRPSQSNSVDQNDGTVNTLLCAMKELEEKQHFASMLSRLTSETVDS